MSSSLLDFRAVRGYLRQRILCSVPMADKRVALSFDDGPHPLHTPQLLELLGSKKIVASFFLVGRRVRRHRELVAQIQEGGHEIGNHGDHHVPLSLLPRGLIRREIEVTEQLICRAGGTRPRLMRPPMGWFDGRVLEVSKELGYEAVIGSIHPRDSRRPGIESIVEHVLERVEPGAIIILHDGGWRLAADRSQSIAATDRITDELLLRGYAFETVSQLIRWGEESLSARGGSGDRSCAPEHPGP